MTRVLTDRDSGDENTISAELQKVIDHRYRRLMRTGYRGKSAQLLAQSTWVDLHTACQLLQRGCDEKTALKILL